MVSGVFGITDVLTRSAFYTSSYTGKTAPPDHLQHKNVQCYLPRTTHSPSKVSTTCIHKLVYIPSENRSDYNGPIFHKNRGVATPRSVRPLS